MIENHPTSLQTNTLDNPLVISNPTIVTFALATGVMVPKPLVKPNPDMAIVLLDLCVIVPKAEVADTLPAGCSHICYPGYGYSYRTNTCAN